MLFENNDVSTKNPRLSGRTQDYSFLLPDRLFIVPKEYPLKNTPKKAKNCSSATGFVGVGASANHDKYDKRLLDRYGITKEDLSVLMKDSWYEGLNSCGLSASALFFDGAEYPEKSVSNAGSNTVEVGNLYFVGYVLRNYDSVRSLYNDLKPDTNGESNLEIVSVKLPSNPSKTFSYGQHMVFVDREGNSLVVEFINGNTVLHQDINKDEEGYEEVGGVLTNNPQYEWHRENLNNYRKLSFYYDPDIHEPCGGGLIHLPGDSTSVSRFVRAYHLRKAVSMKNDLPPVIQALQLIHSVAVPAGTVISKNDEDLIDFTQFISIRDHTNRAIYFSTYKNPTLRKFDLLEIDLEGDKIREFDLYESNDPWYIDGLENVKEM